MSYYDNFDLKTVREMIDNMQGPNRENVELYFQKRASELVMNETGIEEFPDNAKEIVKIFADLNLKAYQFKALLEHEMIARENEMAQCGSNRFKLEYHHNLLEDFRSKHFHMLEIIAATDDFLFVNFFRNKN